MPKTTDENRRIDTVPALSSNGIEALLGSIDDAAGRFVYKR